MAEPAGCALGDSRGRGIKFDKISIRRNTSVRNVHNVKTIFHFTTSWADDSLQIPGNKPLCFLTDLFLWFCFIEFQEIL